MEAKPLTELIAQTLETLAPSKDQPTTAKPASESLSDSAKSERRQRWQDKWLKMRLHHPQLRALADECYSFAQDAYHRPKDGRLLILYGPNGCGKTHAARSLKAWFDLIRIKMNPVAITTEEGTEAMMPSCCYRMWPAVVAGFKQDQWLIVDNLIGEYLTILDDVGAEHDPSGFGKERLYLILSRREHRYTIITTNLAPAEWETKLERRIASRLFRNATHLDLTEVPDYNA